MKIKTEYVAMGMYVADDMDTDPERNIRGHGKSPEEAINSLVEQLIDAAEEDGYAQGAKSFSEEREAFTLTQRNADTQDAERYRYLRNVAGQYGEDEDGPMVCDGLGDNFDFLRGVEVDESVDRAMAAWKAAGSPMSKVAA